MGRTRLVKARPLLVLAVALLVAGLAACGGSENASPPSPTTPAGSSGGSDEILTIEEALASAPAEPVTVRGYLVATKDASVQLCSALAESYPPQCGGASLVLDGLDLATVQGLTTPTEPDYAHTSWTESPISVHGTLSNGVLTVDEP
jgi:hypothetical protein